MKYKVVNLIIKTDPELTAGPTRIRGYFGNRFKEHPILHNHYANDNFLYSYPFVQYKVINGEIVVVGIDEGADLIKDIAPELSVLNLDNDYEIKEKLLHEKTYDIKPSSEEKHYRFITPWLGLNQKNYPRYINAESWKEKKDILNKTLVGNILSMSKGLGIIVNKRLYAKTHFDEKIVHYKGVKMNAFTGEFKIHYDIPDYFGLGKGVSQGFGCVKQIFDDE